VRGGGEFLFFVDDRFSDIMMGRKEEIHARNLQTTRSSQVYKTGTLK
jgi:hypothetical protein